jgi:hypothetical protein
MAAAVLGGCAALLGLAGWIVPDPTGSGSHRQLGLAPCAMPVLTGLPCPTCGMTTAFAYAVRGQIGKAFHAQPVGLILALLTMATFIGSLGALITALAPRINWYRVNVQRLVFGGILCILTGWAYKVVIVLWG